MKNNAWILYSVAAALFWGVWGVISKLIAENVNPYTNHVLFTLGMLFTLPLVLKKLGRERPNRPGIGWGLVAGVLAVLGNVAVFQSFSLGGLAAIVIPLTNLYPLITIGIAVLVLGEKLSWVNRAGILLAVPAVVFLSGQSQLFENPAAVLGNFGASSWLLFALVALIFWGVFSAAQKVATNHVSAEWAYAAFMVASAAVALLFLASGLCDFSFSAKTFGLGSLAGMLNGLGVLCSFAAYRAEGKAAQVTTIAGALQPVFTIALAIAFLGESITWVETVGIGLAMMAALLLSDEPKKTAHEPHPV